MFGRKKRPEPPADEPVCIVSAADTLELGMVTELFQEQGLPFLTKEVLPAGGLFRIAAGFAPCGMDIYVRASDAPRAQALLNGIHFRALPGEDTEV